MNASPHAAAPVQLVERPRLVFFYSSVSGRCRRAEGFLAQVLQRRHNHDTFALHRVSVDKHPEVATRFKVNAVPSILVVDGRRVVRRITSVPGCRELERELAPWLK